MIYAFQSIMWFFFMACSRYWVLGYVAPVFFAGAVIILGALKPGYSHVYSTISELGEIGSTTAQAASLVFITTGIMITLFGYGLNQQLLRGDKMVWTGMLVMIYGLLDFIGSGVFPIEPGGAATSTMSTIHIQATIMGELAAVGMPILFLYDTEGIRGWEDHRRFSRIAFGVSLPLIAFLGYCINGHTPGMMDTPIGLAQRLLVGLFQVWIMVTAHRLRNR